jgi:glutaconate CoA-transferase subunit A
MTLLSAREAARLISRGMSVGIGGFGLDRKPLTLIDSLIESGVRELDLLVYAGGLDVERLVTADAIRRIAFSHVGLDQFGLAPAFRKAREAAHLEAEEWSEWSMLVAWRAAAERAPFATVAIDPSTELFRVNPSFSRMRCPFSGTETAVVKAPKIDVALLQAEAVHPDGWVINAGDEYADVLLARAAALTVVCAERLVDNEELERRWREVQIIDSVVDHVVLAPGGASPGSCQPLYGVDSAAIVALLGQERR